MSNLRRAVLVWLLVSIPLGTTTALNAHVHQDSNHSTSHHDGAQSHRHAPDRHDEPDADHDDALTLFLAAVGLPGAPFTAAGSMSGTYDSLPVAVPLRFGSPPLLRRCQPIDQSPPGDPPNRLSFKRGPPR